MEKDNIIEGLNKVGFNQSYKTQEQLHEEETNRKAMKDMQESYIEKEQINKEKLEAAYRAEINHLKKEITKQKEANMTNSESALARISMQQMAIDNLQKEKDNYKHEVEKITRVNQSYKNELEKMTKLKQQQEAELKHKNEEIFLLINNEKTLNENIKGMYNKIKIMEENEDEHQRDQTKYRKEIEDLKAS